MRAFSIPPAQTTTVRAASDTTRPSGAATATDRTARPESTGSMRSTVAPVTSVTLAPTRSASLRPTRMCSNG